MSAVVASTKFQQMVQLLRADIESGKFAAGSQLPIEPDLCRTYQVSRNTLRESVSVLVQGGYLRRMQGKGTFVLPRTSPSTMETYAVFNQARAHLYGAETQFLAREIQRKGALSLIIDTADLSDTGADEAVFSRLMSARISGVVAEETWARRLAEFCGRNGIAVPPMVVLNLVGTHHLMKDVKYVLSDLTRGTRMGTQHLLGLGHRSIVFVIHRGSWIRPEMAPDLVPDAHGEILHGYTRALADAGLAGGERFFFLDHEFAAGSEERETFRQLLSGPKRPDAVFAFGDSRAKHVIDIAAEAGLRVPDDLAVMGYWNTPWAELVRVPLTSVCIQEEEIARIAAEKIVEARRQGRCATETVMVPPKLVIRDSCGAKRAAAMGDVATGLHPVGMKEETTA